MPPVVVLRGLRGYDEERETLERFLRLRLGLRPRPATEIQTSRVIRNDPSS